MVINPAVAVFRHRKEPQGQVAAALRSVLPSSQMAERRSKLDGRQVSVPFTSMAVGAAPDIRPSLFDGERNRPAAHTKSAPAMLSWRSWCWVTRFVTWLATQYFTNHIVLSAGTRNVAINLDVARSSSSWLPHCIGRQSVWLFLKRPVLLYFRWSFSIFGMASRSRPKKGDSSKCK
jgi:hypothetical protein